MSSKPDPRFVHPSTIANLKEIDELFLEVAKAYVKTEKPCAGCSATSATHKLGLVGKPIEAELCIDCKKAQARAELLEWAKGGAS